MTDSRPWRARGMPLRTESLVPWLAAATVVAGLLLAAVRVDADPSGVEWAVLVLGLVGLLAAACLVAIRSRAELEEVEREERTRPAPDELDPDARSGRGDAVGGARPGSPAYVQGMAAWTAANLELLTHAAELADHLGRPAANELATARDDTEALAELLATSVDGPLGVNETASLHAICTLWETNQGRLEALAADVDPRWHRRWRARAIVHRRLRHGARPRPALALPYRS